MKLFVVATFSGPGNQLPSVIGTSPHECLESDVCDVLEAFLQGSMETIHLIVMKERPT